MKNLKDFWYKLSCLIRYRIIFDDNFYGRLRRSIWMSKSTNDLQSDNPDRITFSETNKRNDDSIASQSEKEITAIIPIIDRGEKRYLKLVLSEELYSSDYLFLNKSIAILSTVGPEPKILWVYSKSITMGSSSYIVNLEGTKRSEAVRYYDMLREKINL